MKEEFNFAYCNSINCWFCNPDGCSWSKRQTHTCGLDTYNELLKISGYKIIKEQEPYCGAVDNILNGGY